MRAAALRHALAIGVLPFTVVILVPLWLASRYAAAWQAPENAGGWLAVGAGVPALASGLALFLASLRRFAAEGEGTLAPWDPTQRLVVRGPYRYVRNPMISGVLFVLLAEALVLRSLPHLAWAAAFLVANALYIPLSEEPGLEERFGDAYRRYRANVPRFLPRLTPWTGA
jgi:protein-S-isoprenylcysteine O-methyltransferase Ste14